MPMRAASCGRDPCGGGGALPIPRVGTRTFVVNTETMDLNTTVTIYTDTSFITFARASVVTWGITAMDTSALIIETVMCRVFQFIM